MSKTRIYIDTNVLIWDFLFRKTHAKEVKAMQASKALAYYFARPQKLNLYVASFSLMQIIATLQKKKISQQAIIEEINRIKQKMTVVDFSLNDITTGIDNYAAYRQTKDLEDNIQFCMSLKMKCHYFVTDNIKDYKDFTNISILAMKDYRTVEL